VTTCFGTHLPAVAIAHSLKLNAKRRTNTPQRLAAVANVTPKSLLMPPMDYRFAKVRPFQFSIQKPVNATAVSAKISVILSSLPQCSRIRSANASATLPKALARKISISNPQVANAYPSLVSPSATLIIQNMSPSSARKTHCRAIFQLLDVTGS
jgi:hypothetical protein